MSRLPHDKVLRVTSIAQAEVVAHAEAHGVSRYEAADSLILTGAAAEKALIEALEVDPPHAGEFVVLTLEAQQAADSWAAATSVTRAEAASDLLMRGFRRLRSLATWRKKQPPRRKTAGEAA